MTPSSAWYETPDLIGDHVKLVQLRPEHAAGLLKAADDDEVFRLQSFARPTTLDEAKGLHDWYTARPNAITKRSSYSSSTTTSSFVAK